MGSTTTLLSHIMHNVLIVGLERAARKRLASMVEGLGLTAMTVGTVPGAKAAMGKHVTTAVMIDCGVDSASGLEALATLPFTTDQIVVFLLHDLDGPLSEAIAAVDSPMFEVVPRTFDEGEIARACRRIKQSDRAKETVPKKFESMLGNCPEMLEVYNVIAKVAPTTASILICGESGTGKELVAQAIHERSDRSARPFVAVNCGAIAENLIESELFGHNKGAFTGADKTHAGVFEQADGGTLFLDEITEMPLDMQVRLLRVLETGTLRRLGAEKELRVDVRVVAATNRQPNQAVEEGQFREDLMYRLAVFPITLPPLRERDEDVLLLAGHFLSLHNKENGTHKRLSPLAHDRLLSYDWPGNIRQLRNMVQRAYILEGSDVQMDCLEDLMGDADTGTCDAAVNASDDGSAKGGCDDSSETVPEDVGPNAADDQDGLVHVEVGTPLDEAEKQLILKTLDEYEGNKTETAKVLGISLKTLYNRLNSYEQQA